MSEAVENLLRDKGLQFTVSGRDFLIKCLNPEHDDSNPSLRVDRISGVAHCFACGWKHNLFKYYGIITNTTPIKVAKIKQKLKELQLSLFDVEMPKGSTPYNRPFRGLNVATLKHFGAFYTVEDKEWEDRVIFPIKDITGKITNFIGRHVDASAKPKYIIKPSNQTVFPYPVVLEEPSKSIILVEGIIDMMNMYDKGARNVVCAFGTQNLHNNVRQKLMPYKVQGVTKVFILFDGDDAGRNAANELKPKIEEHDFEVEIIDLPDDMDPGELSKEYVDSIVEYTK